MRSNFKFVFHFVIIIIVNIMNNFVIITIIIIFIIMLLQLGLPMTTCIRLKKAHHVGFCAFRRKSHRILSKVSNLYFYDFVK